MGLATRSTRTTREPPRKPGVNADVAGRLLLGRSLASCDLTTCRSAAGLERKRRSRPSVTAWLGSASRSRSLGQNVGAPTLVLHPRIRPPLERLGDPESRFLERRLDCFGIE